MKKGFTLFELLVVIAIIGILVTIIVTALPRFGKVQALDRDAEVVMEILHQAHSQTLSSHNDTQYGVHVGSNTLTLFTGGTYSAGASSNQVFTLQTSGVVLTPTLTGGGSDVVFKRLSGETTQDGTIVISSPTISGTKTVTIYRTGIITSN